MIERNMSLEKVFQAFLIGKRRLSEVNYLNGLCGAGEKDSVFVLEGHAPCWALPRLTRLENQKHKGGCT
jgi:hypothetical protein